MKLRSYAIVTGAYWSFLVTDGALRIVVLLYFHGLGYNAFALAMLFVLYEVLGVVSNSVGDRMGPFAATWPRGLRTTLVTGLGLQIATLALVALHRQSWPGFLAVAWVMAFQGLSGVSKHLTETSARTAVGFGAPDGAMFRRVAASTGSRYALQGAGFFVGATLFSRLGFRSALLSMAVSIVVVLVLVLLTAGDLARAKPKPRSSAVRQTSPTMTRLAAARFFLVGSRDIWFVVALPLFLGDTLDWSFEAIGAFLACWVTGYGIMQSLAPHILIAFQGSPLGALGFLPPMAATAMLIAVSVWTDELPALITVAGLAGFGVMSALTSSAHSYLALSYSRSTDRTALDIGHYAGSKAAGRLVGTVLSGLLYVVGGFPAALVGSAAFVIMAFAISCTLPSPQPDTARVADVAIS